MAFSPTNLSIMSLGSGKLTIATVNDDVATVTSDTWTSGIRDIQSVIPYCTQASTGTGTPTGIAVSFTQSSGTIHVYRNSTSAFTLLVISGFAEDLTW